MADELDLSKTYWLLSVKKSEHTCGVIHKTWVDEIEETVLWPNTKKLEELQNLVLAAAKPTSKWTKEAIACVHHTSGKVFLIFIFFIFFLI